MLRECLYSGSTVFARGLPSPKALSGVDVASVLREVLIEQCVEGSSFTGGRRDALDKCFQNGWLDADVLPSQETVYFFATELHRWVINSYLGSEVENPNIQETDLVEFAFNVIRLFSPLQLAAPRIGSSFKQRPPEAHFQDEFYRCSHLHSSGSLVSFPEFGTAKGRVDFYIKSKKWGVELVREGDRLQQHSNHFAPGGSYAKELDIDDYIILDFRTRDVRVKQLGESAISRFSMHHLSPVQIQSYTILSSRMITVVYRSLTTTINRRPRLNF
jgi:hypothetical protein